MYENAESTSMLLGQNLEICNLFYTLVFLKVISLMCQLALTLEIIYLLLQKWNRIQSC